MKRIFMTAAAILALIQLRAQTSDTAAYKSRKLKLDEINLVSSYYTQDGDNAAVTGGSGSQKLSDIANVIDVKFIGYDKKLRKKTLDAELGIDHYTSASSDKVDLKANTSASYSDTRFYPSVTYSVENELKGSTISAGISSSTEYDYQSFGGSISYSRKTKNRSGELTGKLQAFIDQVSKVSPIELRNGGGDEDDEGSAGRNTFAGSLSYTQVINKQLQVAFLADVVQQQGFLSMPFYRVYFSDGSVHQEKLPDARFKLPLGFRANYFAGDQFIIRTYYRFYTDSWGLNSHTAGIEVPVKINAFLSVSPFYRYYSQTGVDYFEPYRQHAGGKTYYTSNYDLSAFRSSFVGAGIRMAPPAGVFNWNRLRMLELRYGHYTKNIGMKADIVSLNLQIR